MPAGAPARRKGRSTGTPQRPQHRQQEQHGRRAQRAEQQRHRVGLADVADHLARVQEVVHGDEVEARAELVPEHELGQRHEQREPKDRRRQNNIERRSHLAAAPRVWRQPGHQREGQQHETRHAEVVDEAQRQPQRQAQRRERRPVVESEAVEQRQAHTRTGAQQQQHQKHQGADAKAASQQYAQTTTHRPHPFGQSTHPALPHCSRGLGARSVALSCQRR